jgi:hypothetical protein
MQAFVSYCLLQWFKFHAVPHSSFILEWKQSSAVISPRALVGLSEVLVVVGGIIVGDGGGGGFLCGAYSWCWLTSFVY